MSRKIRLRHGPYDGNLAIPYDRVRLCTLAKQPAAIVAANFHEHTGSAATSNWLYYKTSDQDPQGHTIYRHPRAR